MGKEILPQPPIIIFLGDGAEFEIFEIQNTVKNNKPAKRMVMSPFDWTLQTLKIGDETLNFDLYSHGTLERTYPASRIVQVSDNPLKPIYLAFCTFDGNPINLKGDLGKLGDIIEEKERLEARLATAEMTISRLEKDNTMLAIRSKEHFETMRSITESEGRLITPVKEQPIEKKQFDE